MRVATIYKFPKKGYLIHAESKAKSGFWIASEPFIQLSENTSSSELVSALKASLIKDDIERVEDPKDWSSFGKFFLEMTGLKSIGQLHKKTVKCCGVQLENDWLSFIPNDHAEKLNDGFIARDTLKVIVAYHALDTEIAQGLEVAFSKCN